MGHERFRRLSWLAAASMFVSAAFGCSEPRCPSGYVKRGDTCDGLEDAGVDASKTEPDDAPAAAGPDSSSDRDADSHDADATSEPRDDACDPSPCQHGGRCWSAEQDFGCDCEGTGYEGPTCAADRDECATLNACNSAAYPCAQVAPSGYTCKGQFADWPMPDALAGSGHAPIYDISTAGVGRDTVTGLSWQRVLGENPNGYTWLEAKLYCDQLELAGHADWRLPSKIELESIVDDIARPAHDRLVFGVPGAVVWSVSPVVGEPERRWLVDFLDGSSGYSSAEVSTALDVRCVRGPADATWSGLAASRYTVDTAGDAVADNRTGLVWQRTLSTGTHTWEGAQAYCAALGPNWRLPTYKQLLTLVDPTRSNPSIDPVFPETPAVSFWTASRSLGSDGTPDWPRRVDFSTGASDFSASTAANRVRCVR
jgi:hypothetical protein